ncbi:hypothetical protein ACFOOM_23395 [Streptomyces echinoruber]|uniref:Uncharacterized protein n=1 Tax=Streptomyces echinoruber TaxID=68898 RepID=A0A918RAE7_9ACTN|nr:hypothetical protein [Streptomyces echinoruber]GGZ91927.1 hypothetical protein GCM10010389_33090 [Streptomyces echinoruber]
MIEESHVRELLKSRDDDAALILLEGGARVVESAARTQDHHAGAPVLITKAELVDRLGTPTPADHDVRTLARALDDAVGKLGA